MTVKKWAAVMVFMLGCLAALTGGSDPTGQNIDEIAKLVELENDHISTDTLANWITESKQMRIVDLRDSSAYPNYHIPGAELMTLSGLINSSMRKDELIILYSEGGIHAGQAWVMLKAKHFQNVFIISGGLAAWRSEILFPVLSLNASESEKVIFAQRSKMSLYFGGSPAVMKETAKQTVPMKRSVVPKKIEPLKFEKEAEKTRDGC